MTPRQGSLLAGIETPEDLRKIKDDQLPQLCREIRNFIIDVISANPGHLGASLGVVELAVAIHYVFNTPDDKLVWDVGHQAYPHKILTGRKNLFHTNRKYHGISGFPKMAESIFDAFGTGHSSTSISAALGMAVASAIKDENNRQHIAVIGDASMASGMAMEALNNAGVSKSNLLVILNDNGIAIDKSVGALQGYLTDIITTKTYNRVKDKVWRLMGGNTRYGKNSREIVRQVSNAVKSSITKRSNLFEALNLRYFGPVDGHDVVHLVKLLNDLKDIPGPKLLHIVTVKGKGFEKAEKNQTVYHSPGRFNRKTGEIIKESCDNKPLKYQDVFGNTIIELARENPKIVGITPAMPSGCSLNKMMHVMPDRAFDVGIAEQHAVTFSAGLAAQGLVPFCNIYSSFMQRAYDQVIHDVALQNLHVVFCLDRGGLVGEDGATHHGVFDLAFFRAIPNLTMAVPMNEHDLRNMMFSAQQDGEGPWVIRYPRGRGVLKNWKNPLEKMEIGKGVTLRESDKIAVLSLGHPGNFVEEALEGLQKENVFAGHYNMRFLKPLDTDLLHSVFKKYSHVITVEDGTIMGGFGSAVIEFMVDNQYQAVVKRLGVPDNFIEQGSLQELYHECGFDPDSIAAVVKSMV